MNRLAIACAAAIALAGCASPQPPGASGGASASASQMELPFPRCDEIAWVSAAPEHYRDSPIYVANEQPEEAVLAWAQTKPGFEEMWVDREHLGWITLAFSMDAAARQRELVEEFPDVGVVAVEVEWTFDELAAIQQRVSDELGPLFGPSSFISVHQQIVGIGVGVLEPDRVAAVVEHFAGEPICIEGIDPALAPQPGPQQGGGDGWRLLANEQGAGASFRTGVASDQASYERLWTEVGLAADPPAVDFSSEIVVWFGAVYGSSCPNLRLDDVVVDMGRALLHAEIVLVNAPMECTSDANPHAFVVTVERSKLHAGPFAIQLSADDPPQGAPEERTVVEADLSQPGAVAGPGQVHGDPTLPEPYFVESGGIVEPGYPVPYRFPVHCGTEWLGELNGVHWRIEMPASTTDPVLPEWQPDVTEAGILEVTILLELEPEARVTATANDHPVDYVPSAEEMPDCD